jgi:hypothetical protein
MAAPSRAVTIRRAAEFLGQNEELLGRNLVGPAWLDPQRRDRTEFLDSNLESGYSGN